MDEISFPTVAVSVTATVFALAGAINVTAIRPVREIYAEWDIPPFFYRTLGIVELAAAALLATPELRVWGIALGGPIMFGSIILLLDQRHYAYAVAAMVLMAALVPATLSIPPSRSYVLYPAEVRQQPVTITAELANETTVSTIRISENH